MQLVAQIIFLIITGVAGFFIYKSISRIRRNILLGRPEDRSGNTNERIKRTLLIAFGQKKMFRNFIPAFLHLFVYLGFLIVNIEILEIVIDGLAGTHRVFAPFIDSIYPFLIDVFEFFAVSVIIGCIIFLIRRNILKVNRFKGIEMTSWPLLDANTILTMEIFLMIAFLTMNASDQILQMREQEHYFQTGSFLFSSALIPVFQKLDTQSLIYLERFCWWAHIIGVFLFANYVFYNSKHLHIFMSFPNVFFSKLEPQGKFTNMPEVTKEVRLMLNLPVDNAESNTPIARFGAKDATDLTWKNLMDAYSCTECGRCTSNCPANITGKKLSPRKIMMDTRDRIEEIGKNIETKGADYNDGKSLLGDYISAEEINACTTCNACVEACPVTIDPLNIIMQLRRYKIMEESQAPASWNMMFSNIENNSAPWKFSPSDRFKWSEKLK